MAGDYSRFSFRHDRRVAAVTMQQGRVQLDADWNEQASVVDWRIRNLARDVWGPAWVSDPLNEPAFALQPTTGPDLSIGAGRLYADGLAPEVFADEAWTYLKQPFLPVPPPIPDGPGLAYLDVFIRELTWVEAPDLLEKAMHGVDTAARRQVAWQVKLHAAGDATCGTDLNALFPPSAARLSTSATAIPASDDPCILSPMGGYRGLENRLYRVQIHVVGPRGEARFKWSRENASVVSPVESILKSGTKSEVQVLRIGRDAVLRFSPGDWVEVTDDHRELMGEAGDMARVEAIDETTRTLFLDRVVPDPTKRPFGTTQDEIDERHTRVIRWDQNQERLGNAVGTDGLMAVGTGPIALEDGIEVSFGLAPAAGRMKVDDHWSFEARTADGTIRELTAAPPHGIRHVLVPLAAYRKSPTGIVVDQDCRTHVPLKGGSQPEPRPDPCRCCTICVAPEGGDARTLEEAVGLLGNIAAEEPVRLCLAPGRHEVAGSLTIARPNVLVIGCFPRSRLVIRRGPLVFAGARSGLIDVVVEGAADPAPVVFSGSGRASEQIVRGCRFEIAGEGGAQAAIFADQPVGLRIEDNDLSGGGIRVRGRARDLRIEGNRIQKVPRSAIVMTASDSGAGAIHIHRNHLTGGGGAGIETQGVIQDLEIIGNAIEDWQGENLDVGKVAGGVALETVERLVVRDNRIVRNGTAAPSDCAGIHIRRGLGVEIERNRIEDNGRTDPPEGMPILGGIVIDDIAAPTDRQDGRRELAGLALVVHGNTVRAPLGHALYVIGQGDMRVQDNALTTARGTARGIGGADLSIRDMASTVLIAARSLEALATKLIDAARPSADPSGTAGDLPILRLIQEAGRDRELADTPGRIMLQNNQVTMEGDGRLDSENPIIAAVTVWGFQDVDLSHNQVEIVPALFRYFASGLVLGRTTRQVGNRFSEPEENQGQRPLCVVSLLSYGEAMNTASLNQGTHCVLPFGPHTFEAGNTVLKPSQLCPG